ncbi:unnamed protein product [Onchocerca flexuosa]|uniref:Homeobox domain-containing protein n=1 Tax=Onchocerca flexuosa TaxID=387005 RepID=A0A183HFR4_9BILA|nr:unnamed protein product [Onchocerca flexuosa]
MEMTKKLFSSSFYNYTSCAGSSIDSRYSIYRNPILCFAVCLDELSSRSPDYGFYQTLLLCSAGFPNEGGETGLEGKNLAIIICNSGVVRTSEKYRMVYSDYQRLELEKEFRTSQFINSERKSQLSSELQLTERQIKIWFQNRLIQSIFLANFFFQH